MATIALIGNGMRGHFGPLSRLARTLAGQGHQLIVWAPAERLAELGAGAVRCRPHEPVRLASTDLPSFAVELAEATADASEEMIEALHSERVELVIHDTHLPWARLSADFLGLPRIVTTPLFPVVDARNGGHPTLPTHGFGSPGADQIERVAAAGRSVMRRWGIELGDAWRVIWSGGPATASFSTAEITGQPERFPAWTYVGPLPQAPPAEAVPGERPLVYVSFGTVDQPVSAALGTVITALAGEPMDVLVSLGGRSVAAAGAEALPDNVEVYKYVDGPGVLAGASVFVTHGGCGSVHEALLAGVPMLCQPQGADQFAWSRRVSELGAGRWVTATVPQVRGAVRELLSEPGYASRARALGAALERFDGPRRLAELVAAVLD